MRRYLLIFITLTVLVFISYSKSLGLTLYADDWIVIAKYLHLFGPGKQWPYWRIDTWVNDYGFQNLFALLWLIFKDNSLPYYIFNLLCRSLASFSIFYFASRLISLRVGLLVGVLYSLSSIGAETTDWVYNFPSYLGLAIAMLGLTWLITSQTLKKLTLGILIVLVGYIVAPIRLYLLPPLLPFLILGIKLVDTRKMTQKKLFDVGKIFLFSVSLLVAFKLIFPHIGNVHKDMVEEGFKLAEKLLSQGRYDFLLIPFINVGRMLLPVILWPESLLNAPIQRWMLFFIQGLPILLIGVGITYVVGITRKASYLVLINIGLLIILKLFIRWQGQWGLNSLSYLIWADLGLLLTLITSLKVFEAVIKKETKLLAFYLVAATGVMTFLFPQQNNPLLIFPTIHRYLTFPAVGICLLVGYFFIPHLKRGTRFSDVIKSGLLFIIIISQLIAIDQFFSYQTIFRNPNLSKTLFSQIRSQLPVLPQDQPVIFYFDYPVPQTYYQLLYSSFGYRMQLIYNVPYEETNIPSTVNNYQDLIKEINNRHAPLDHVYGFKWVSNGDLVTGALSGEGRLVDISIPLREQLAKDIAF